MKQPNVDFINICEVCGKETLCLSEIKLIANYGSKYDGETLTLYTCGDCIDLIFDTISKK